MKYLFVAIIVFENFVSSALSQLPINKNRDIPDKPQLDTSILDKWPSVGDATISNNGKYVFYSVFNLPASKTTFVVRDVQGGWKKEIMGAQNVVFTKDSKSIIFVASGDSLEQMILGEEVEFYLASVSSFKLFQLDGVEKLLYKSNNDTKELVLYDLLTKKKQVFTNVIGYVLSEKGHALVVQQESGHVGAVTQSLDWVTLPSGSHKRLWVGIKASSLVLDGSERQLAFKADCLRYYLAGTDSSEALVTEQSININGNFKIEKVDFFSRDGSRLFFTVTEQNRPLIPPDAVKVDVWSYHDARLQSEQLLELSPRSFSEVVSIASRDVTRLLCNDDEKIIFNSYSDEYAVISRRIGAYGEGHWNQVANRSYFVVSTLNGKKTQAKLGTSELWGMSPNGRYIIAKAFEGACDVYSYDQMTGVTKNLTKDIAGKIDPVFTDAFRRNVLKFLEIGNWLYNGQYLLIYDQYDIWQVSVSDEFPPVNITNGYGRSHHIVFRVAGHYTEPIIGKGALILTAFNKLNKNSGFFSIILGEKRNPELLTMGRYKYELSHTRSEPILKARDVDIFLVKRGSMNQMPNWFSTTDFKTFTPISDIYTERNWNWMKAELLAWKAFDGHAEQGILYKPENFDSKKKYPVIVTYYEKRSDEFNEYKAPYAIRDNINIPWFVSHNYLVFVPDIFYRIGLPGKSVYNSVISGVKMLIRFPWVNSRRIGIQGHSYGGYETNYLITHCSLFAAAMSSSGVSDMVSDYGSLEQNSGSMQWKFEVGQHRIGATLWERTDLYIENSPIFRADKVATPLLMMNNKADGAVPFAQGVELFTALRRLGKKVWMLQYDDGGHTLVYHKDAILHTIMVSQFFDYYLKGALPPRWLTQGIPATRKGLDTGLELDASGDKP